VRRVLVESSYGSIWRELMEGISFYVRAQHVAWQIHCITTPEIVTGLDRDADGLLCIIPNSRADLVAAVKRSQTPAVNMLRDITPVLPSVLSDNEAVGERAAEYFLARGFRSFAFVGIDRTWSDSRLRGFTRRLAKGDRRPSPLIFPPRDVDLKALAKPSLLRALERWLAPLQPPVAIFCAADFISRAVLEACLHKKLRVPEDVAILGVDDDSAICDLSPVSLSSIPQNLPRIGFEAARLLDGHMTGRRHSKRRLLIAPREIVVRRSTDLIAVDNPQVAAALRRIHADDPRSLNMKTILAEARVSRQWLDRQFKELLGRTPSEEIRQRKLQEARKLLLQTHLPIREIAIRCGFTQGENLTRFFTECMGVSPTEFRKRLGSPL
jgi:LacI family transcriptional regulator